MNDHNKPNCICGLRSHITEIGLCRVSIAFLTYIMRITDKIRTPLDDIGFYPISIKFGTGTAKWVTVFGCSEGHRIEYWIIFEGNEPSAIVTKYRKDDGEVNVAFSQLYIQQSIDPDKITPLILGLPDVLELFTKGSHHENKL